MTSRYFLLGVSICSFFVFHHANAMWKRTVPALSVIGLAGFANNILTSDRSTLTHRSMASKWAAKKRAADAEAKALKIAEEAKEGKTLERKIAEVKTGKSAEFDSTRIQNRIIPLRSDDPRVPPEFAALGRMVQVGDLILSGVAPEEMEWREAISFCKNLDAPLPIWSGGAWLPTDEEWLYIEDQAKDFSGKFHPELLDIPSSTDGAGYWDSVFWTSTKQSSWVAPSGDSNIFGSAVTACAFQPGGLSNGFFTYTSLRVRCVRSARESSIRKTLIALQDQLEARNLEENY